MKTLITHCMHQSHNPCDLTGKQNLCVGGKTVEKPTEMNTRFSISDSEIFVNS